MSKIVKGVAKGTEERVSGTVKSVVGTLKSVLGRARNATVGTVGLAKDIITLNTKGMQRDARKIGDSAVGVVSNVAKGTVRTARVALTGKTGDKKTRKVNKKQGKSKN